jgi:predicted DNA-binding transcriptional regulator YafY
MEKKSNGKTKTVLSRKSPKNAAGKNAAGKNGAAKKAAVRTMPPRLQVFRLARIASLLKKNSCPTAEKLLREYERIEFEEGKTIRAKYSLRTVYRDIDTLRNDFGCPVKYDRANKVYYLADHDWEFNCPAQLSESAMLALVIGSRIAEEVFPDPVRARISKAVDEILKGNSPDFLETTLVRSLMVFAEAGDAEDSPAFPVVFEAWQKHRRIRILYDDMKGGLLERDVDPHVLFLYMHQWRIKAFCHLRNEPRTFVVNRIRTVRMLPETFAPDYGIINSVTLDTIVSFRKMRDVKIRLTGDAPKFAKANRFHTKQNSQRMKDGSWIFRIPEVSQEAIVPWILSQQGEAVPLQPPELVSAVRKAAGATLDSLPPDE